MRTEENLCVAVSLGCLCWDHMTMLTCRDDVFVSWPRELLKGLTHLNLALAVGVDLGGVEEVDLSISVSERSHLNHTKLSLHHGSRQSRGSP